ncbi:MAG: acyltransferase [Clostridia bacterium]|nr:acyltransferase [Clostridia bacterium]
MKNPIRIWLDDANSAPDTRHVDTCDGIRAAAILIVAWFHIWQQSWLYPGLDLFGEHISFDPLVRSGYMWVDIMILISGFCLALPWSRLRYEGGAKPDTLDFYAKRLIRIHPSYLFAVTVMFIIALATGAYYSMAHLKLDIFSHLTYTHTFFYDAYYASNLGGALWTLAIELQFYLIFPFIAREFLKSPVMTVAAMVSTSLAVRGYIGDTFSDVSLYFNQLPAYLDSFALGMLAAEVHVWLSKRRHNAILRIACSVGCVVVIALFWDVVRAQAHMSGTMDIRRGQMAHRLPMSLLGAALLVLSANAGLIVRRILGNPVTRFVSAVSMQFYIWHQTMAVWIIQYRLIPSTYEHPNYEGDHRWQVIYTAVCFLGGLAVAAALTYGFERPIAKALQNKWNAWRSEKRAQKEA